MEIRDGAETSKRLGWGLLQTRHIEKVWRVPQDPFVPDSSSMIFFFLSSLFFCLFYFCFTRLPTRKICLSHSGRPLLTRHRILQLTSAFLVHSFLFPIPCRERKIKTNWFDLVVLTHLKQVPVSTFLFLPTHVHTFPYGIDRSTVYLFIQTVRNGQILMPVHWLEMIRLLFTVIGVLISFL